MNGHQVSDPYLGYVSPPHPRILVQLNHLSIMSSLEPASFEYSAPMPASQSARSSCSRCCHLGRDGCRRIWCPPAPPSVPQWTVLLNKSLLPKMLKLPVICCCRNLNSSFREGGLQWGFDFFWSSRKSVAPEERGGGNF